MGLGKVASFTGFGRAFGLHGGDALISWDLGRWGSSDSGDESSDGESRELHGCFKGYLVDWCSGCRTDWCADGWRTDENILTGYQWPFYISRRASGNEAKIHIEAHTVIVAVCQPVGCFVWCLSNKFELHPVQWSQHYAVIYMYISQLSCCYIDHGADFKVPV